MTTKANLVMSIDLNDDEIELLYFCLEQMESCFNLDEQELCNEIIAKFQEAQAELAGV